MHAIGSPLFCKVEEKRDKFKYRLVGLSVENFQVRRSYQAFIIIRSEKKWIKSVITDHRFIPRIPPKADWKFRSVDKNSAMIYSIQMWMLVSVFLTFADFR